MMQEAGRPVTFLTNTDNISKSNNKDKPKVTANENGIINYFFPDPNKDNNKKVSAEKTQQLQRVFKDVFTGFGCFDGTHIHYILNQIVNHATFPLDMSLMSCKSHSKWLEQLQQQDITPLGMDETAEWCNSFVLVVKPKGKVRLCLD